MENDERMLKSKEKKAAPADTAKMICSGLGLNSFSAHIHS